MTAFELMAKLGLDSSDYNDALDDAVDSASSQGSRIGSALGTAARLGLDTGEFHDRLDDATGQASSAGQEIGSALGEVHRPEVDTSGFKEKLADAAEAAGQFGEKVGSALKTAAKAGMAAIGGAAAGVGAITKQAVEGYSEYEQLAGGVETLFEGSSNTVLQYAKDAFSSAGLSANEYLDTVTGFSAALIQSTGRGEQQDVNALKDSLEEEMLETKRSLQDQYDERKKYWDNLIRLEKDSGMKEALRAAKDNELKDLKRSNEDRLAEIKQHNKEILAQTEAMNNSSTTTEESLQRAAELANMAVIDMSDNANKMGTSMESLQNAYAGFSKGNYTMLDNLKLGYGGTKEEMERLLAKAEELSGKQYNIASYADIVEAIHEIQKDVGIAGATAKEAEGTIEGSLNAFKAAWQNLVNGLANPDADLGELIGSVVEKGKIALKNLVPAVKQALGGIASLIKEAAPIIAEELPGLIDTVLPDLIDAVGTMVVAVVRNLPQIIGILLEAIPGIMAQIGGELIKTIPDLIGAILGGLSTSGGQIIAVISGLFLAIKGIGIIGSIMNLISTIGSLIPMIMSLINPVGLVVAAVAGAAALIIANWDSIKEAWGAAVEFFGELIEGIKNAMAPIKDAIAGFFESAWDNVKSAWSGVTDFFSGVIDDILNVFSNIPELMMTIGGNLMSGLGNGIIDGAKAVVEKAKQVAGDVLGAIKGFFGINSPSKVMDEQVGQMLGKGEIRGMEKMFPDIKRTADEMSDLLLEGATPTMSSYPVGTYSAGNSRTEQLLITLIETMKESRPITIDGKQVIGYIAPGIDVALGQIMEARQREAVYA